MNAGPGGASALLSGARAVAPVVVAGAAVGAASGVPVLGVVIAGVAVVCAIVREKLEVDIGRQLVASLVGGAIGYSSAVMLQEDASTGLREGWTRMAAAAVLAAAARLVLLRPRGGQAATIALAFAAMIAVGQTQQPFGYSIYAALLLVLGTLSLGGDEVRAKGTNAAPAPRGAGVRRPLVAGAMLAGAAALAVGTTVGLRYGHAWMLRRAQTAMAVWRVQTGFSDRMELGALDGMLSSDAVVMRLWGPRVDYLRGAAFDIYEGGRWLRSEHVEKETEAVWDAPPGAGEVVEMRAVSQRVDRFFLPRDAASIETVPPRVRVDRFGIVKPADRVAPIARFVVGRRDRAPIAPPGPADLTLLKTERAKLTPLAAEWTRGAATAEEKLDAIEKKLAAEYRYARTFVRATALDPALDFILRDRTGHCEYFASAFVLMARALGIPARAVVGYRVAEHNTFGGYYVVRERNAHAWVEAWIDGVGWTIRDPTPADATPGNQPHEAGVVAAAVDRIRIGWDEAGEWLAGRTLGQTGAATAVALFVLTWIIARGARRRRAKLDTAGPDEAPLPCLSSLLRELAREGFTRGDAEPLERLAARVPDPQARGLLLAYAALRYGGIGSADEISFAMAAYRGRDRTETTASPHRGGTTIRGAP